MLTTFESILIITVIVSGSLVFLWLLRRLWPDEQRRRNNEIIGWQASVLGTTYAVVMGFMLYAVWTTFQAAEGNAEAEANSVINVVRTAQGLPVAQRQQIQDLGSEYVSLMLTQEWPAMNNGSFSPRSRRIVQELWAAVASAEIHNAAEQTSLDHTITELSEMTAHRRTRQLQANSDLPGILWSVLIVGGVSTIVSGSLFGSADFRLHLIQVFMLSLLISLVLTAVADINRPFQGSVHVTPAGFERARVALDEMKSAQR